MRISDWSSDVCSCDLLGARRTGSGDGKAGPAQAGGLLHEVAQRMRCVQDRRVEVGREAQAVIGQACVGLLGGADAGGRRAEHEGHAFGPVARAQVVDPPRSDERRVGKECVSTGSLWWSTYHQKKKKTQQQTK